MMEILQTIWSSLTTENPTLTNIIGIPSIFLEAFVSMLLFTTLLNINATKKQKWMYVLIASCFSIVSRLFIPSPYNTFCNLIVIFLIIFFVFKTTILKSFVCLLLPSIIAAAIETILSKLYLVVLNIDYISVINIPINRFCITLIIYCIMFLIYLLIRYLKVNIAKFEIFDKKKKILLIINIIFGLILIATQIYVTYFYSSILPIYIVIIDIISLVSYLVISLYTIFTVSKLETTSMNLEEATLYNKTLQMLQDL